MAEVSDTEVVEMSEAEMTGRRGGRCRGHSWRGGGRGWARTLYGGKRRGAVGRIGAVPDGGGAMVGSDLRAPVAIPDGGGGDRERRWEGPLSTGGRT